MTLNEFIADLTEYAQSWPLQAEAQLTQLEAIPFTADDDSDGGDSASGFVMVPVHSFSIQDNGILTLNPE